MVGLGARTNASGQHSPHLVTRVTFLSGGDGALLPGPHRIPPACQAVVPAIQLPLGSRRAPTLHMANPVSRRGRARGAFRFLARIGRCLTWPRAPGFGEGVPAPPLPAALPAGAAHPRSAGPARGRSGSTGRTTLPPPPARSGAGAPAAAPRR